MSRLYVEQTLRPGATRASASPGATKPHHLTDAIAALDVELSDEEIRVLEEPYTPREPTGF